MMGEELIKDLKNEGMLSEEVSKNALEISRIEAVSPQFNLPNREPSEDKDADFDFGDDDEARMEFARKAFTS